jgi:hypothetical protein
MRAMFGRSGLLTGLLTGVLSASALSQCVTPATYVEVSIDTDAPEGRSFTVSVLSYRTEAPPSAREPLVIERGRGPGQVEFPASFGVVPAVGSGRDHRVTLVLDAVLRGATASEPDVRFRRTARWQFTRGVHGQVRVFLPVRCGSPATGCANVPPQACTVAALCEERSLTCGDDGLCVQPEVVVVPASDAGLDARAPVVDSGVTMDAARSMDAAMDSATDTGRVDTGVVTDTGVRIDTGVVTDTGVRADTGASNNGRSCSGSGTCTGGACIFGNGGGGVCTSSCAGPGDCPPSWTCVATTCRPPTTCTGGYIWTDWNGDGSLQLAAARELGVSAMGSSFTFACTHATSVLQMCDDQLALELTGARASVLAGLIRPRASAMMLPTPTVRVVASGPSVHFRVDNSGTAFNLAAEAPSSQVVISAAGTRALNFVGTINVGQLVINAPSAQVVVMGTINGPVTVAASAGFTNSGRINGTLRLGGAAPMAPACP